MKLATLIRKYEDAHENLTYNATNLTNEKRMQIIDELLDAEDEIIGELGDTAFITATGSILSSYTNGKRRHIRIQEPYKGK